MLGVPLIAAIVYLAWNIGKRSSNQRPFGGIDPPELVQPPHTVYGTKAPDPVMQVVEHPRYELSEGQLQPHELPGHT